MSNPDLTLRQYKAIIDKCRALFEAKTKDYGTAWRILRLPSLTDQIYIKANRIRSIQEKGKQLIEDGIASEFIAIVNYCIMANIQLQLGPDAPLELPLDQCLSAYDNEVETTLALQSNKNHDYGEAWRQMRVSSMTDIILMKLLRIKQIEDHHGVTLVSEGVDANYRDIMNYAIFCLILMGESGIEK
jgi:hypothetical protein